MSDVQGSSQGQPVSVANVIAERAMNAACGVVDGQGVPALVIVIVREKHSGYGDAATLAVNNVTREGAATAGMLMGAALRTLRVLAANAHNITHHPDIAIETLETYIERAGAGAPGEIKPELLP